MKYIDLEKIQKSYNEDNEVDKRLDFIPTYNAINNHELHHRPCEAQNSSDSCILCGLYVEGEINGITRGKRHIYSFMFKDHNIARLVFGTNASWRSELSNPYNLRVKSYGNGSIFRDFCCTSDTGSVGVHTVGTVSTTSLSNVFNEISLVYNGKYNELLGLPTEYVEDLMFTDSAYIRSLKGASRTYGKNKNINTSIAYRTNFESIFNHLNSMRNINITSNRDSIQI